MGLILPDSSVWIPYFRSALTPQRLALRALMQESPSRVAICAPIRMELRFGTDFLARRRIEPTLDNLPEIDLEPAADFELAGDLFREARRIGRPVRSAIDCLIAAIAIRDGAQLVHSDRDFDTIKALFPELDCLRLP